MKRVIAGAARALAGCHKPMLLKSESYKQGYQYVHNLPAFDGHGPGMRTELAGDPGDKTPATEASSPESSAALTAVKKAAAQAAFASDTDAEFRTMRASQARIL